MAADTDTAEARPAWFVGAAFGGGTDDNADRFVREGVWEHRFRDRWIDEVKSIHVGDRIAIKSTYTKKYGLPFDNRGHSVSVMAIKATGIVTGNPGDGRRLAVDWTPIEPHREWYFYTHLPTVWRVVPRHYSSRSLIDFAFEGHTQDIDKFRNFPYWQERFGDNPVSDDRFVWTSFYSGFADQLLACRDDRSGLLDAIYQLPSERVQYLTDRFAEGKSGPLRDICPFTTMGTFNRGMTLDNRNEVACKLAGLLGMEEVGKLLLKSPAGIPTLDSRNSWFFPFEAERDIDHIEALWQVFTDALQYADDSDETNRASLIESFDGAMSRPRVGRMLTFGLFWIRPHTFLSLDKSATAFVEKKLGIDVPKGKPDGETYLDLCEELQLMFNDEGLPVHSFPHLSAMAWDPANETGWDTARKGDQDPPIPEVESLYSVDDIVKEGCFLERDRLETILERWQAKKNLILQGPPGTGKTWLARKLAFALIGSRSPSRVRPLQFHPNLSYEDFVRGWRPSGSRKRPLKLVDGPFLKAVERAQSDPARGYVVVIEEINRGNPAQIFGEMLTLLEADKRTPDEALALSYPRNGGERVHIPDNLYVIGTMNIADRSLALVDLALRRRFAFIDLQPVFGDRWRRWVSEQCGLDAEFLDDIERRMMALNQTILTDDLLGPQFRVGHSVVTPDSGTAIPDPVHWFTQVVETEIGPLLDEYWFDATDKARSARQELLKGLGS
ncbi:MAG: AAA family ATPase [Acidimicrobiaceae bacterium]|nr:AAA family ATPase [Acidimicrobiaceae bacterium]